MSLTGIQDSMVKSHLVQQVQSRTEEVVRLQERTQMPFSQELARQADEVVLNITRTEQDGVRDEERLKDREEEKRKKREEEEREGNSPSPREEEEEPPAEGVGSHRIDTFA